MNDGNQLTNRISYIVNELHNSCALLLLLQKAHNPLALDVRPAIGKMMQNVDKVIGQIKQELFEILQPKHGFRCMSDLDKWIKAQASRPCER